MGKIFVAKLYKNKKNYENKHLTVCGWIKFLRNSKKIGFISLDDGTYIKPLQVIFLNSLKNFQDISNLNIGSAVCVYGKFILTPNAKQPFEIKAEKINIIGKTPSDYILQKKKHSMEFLRTIIHLRPRTFTFAAINRIRSRAAFALQKFLQDNDFFYIHSPIITTNDCEGAGETFTVTTMNLSNPPKTNTGIIDYEKDFFLKHTMLTVSGQLQAECMASALSRVYTFGPTFRAENSNTQRHAAEFWMLEPEIAFSDLSDTINISSSLIKSAIDYVLKTSISDFEFLSETYDKNLINKLENTVKNEFEIISYTEAVNILIKSKVKFEYEIKWGNDLQTEHERYLTEKIFKKPIFVVDYPKNIKAFYMRENKDNKTVAATDMLFPGIGEILGGSQREERLDVLKDRMQKFKLKEEKYQWYLDLRRYGTMKHSGFGLGFERFIMYLTSMTNIRDVLPFPRTVKNADF
ncbi:MAG: asparagine--tRNA ligase [Oscillospiraceae bacterium]|jgi:asparaginyl-tRNA synthetase|nr:asparagine--tRNA ligase [Oscillospiraceae bacterium]